LGWISFSSPFLKTTWPLKISIHNGALSSEEGSWGFIDNQPKGKESNRVFRGSPPQGFASFTFYLFSFVLFGILLLLRLVGLQ
jgi:hypothetical protein